jgi:peptidylprolyl isomerase
VCVSTHFPCCFGLFRKNVTFEQTAVQNMSKGLRHRNFSPTASLGGIGHTGSARKIKSSISGSQVGDYTPSAMSFDEDDIQVMKKRYQDIEERRLREWENYQRSHRSSLEHSSAKAYIDIAINDVPAGRLVIELFEDIVPLTVDNFRSLITGSSPFDPSEALSTPKLDYVDSCVYRVDTKNRCVFLGEINGTNVAAKPSPPSAAASGVNRTNHQREGVATLDDENFAIRHNQKGMLSMVSRGPNTVGSAFSITLDASPALDYKQVVFGKVVDGIGLLEKIEAVPVNRVGAPLTPITITFCGALTGAKPPGVFEPVIRSAAALKEPQLEAQDSVEVGSDAPLSPSSQQPASESNENSTRPQEEVTTKVEADLQPQPLPSAADEGADQATSALESAGVEEETIPVILGTPSPPATIEA